VDTIKFFKDRAKHLHRSLANNVTGSHARVAAVLGRSDGVGLQNVQHVVAVEAGFTQWTQLIEASEDERQLVVAMTQEPQLNAFGIGIYSDHWRKPRAERLSILEADRKSLRGNLEDVTWTAQWLRTNIAPTKTINRRHSSYGLKHMAEKHSPRRYLSNGAFIAAALIAGYRYRVSPESPNPAFGMSERSIKDIIRGRR
jgi:hypothetical protein